ncbi:calcium release-activated calcium channel protein 1-like isoform X3 [Daphnia pulex]|uniref:calcium release-activated calcium channel protein 1-like isoform X3 n=1 Tax=Daphnia pulex TaxID=6669 RepID=UPI001EDFA487|nr:calcium release-activated calcium channel protein 1-like isoform X3 [Daphnia pulex]
MQGRYPPAVRQKYFYANRSRSLSAITCYPNGYPTGSVCQHALPSSSLSTGASVLSSSGDSGISKSWAPKPQGNSTVLQHLHKHASTFGLDVSSLQSRADPYSCAEKMDEKKMSNQGDNIHHQGPAFLSWRKLHLSKAKLKAASNTSALLAGFAMVAVVEIQLNNNNPGGEQLPKPLLFLFAICTTMLVAVHMLALLISTCILPNMEAISNLHILSLVNESPHEKMHMYIELAWGCSTVLGILLFMVEVAILCWIQFYSVLKEAAYVATAILVPFVILFIWFAIIFYRNLVAHTYETRKCGIQELEELKHVLEMGDELTTREIRSSPLVNI